MKSCPKCGYTDPAIWRNTRRKLYTEHCHISDLEQWDPDLARLLKEKRYVFRNGVKYKLTKKGSHVHRIDARLCQYPDPSNDRITEPCTEKHKAAIFGRRKDQKLLEETWLK